MKPSFASDARWTDSGKRTLSSGHIILYSGRSDNQHRGGVAIIVTRKVEKALLCTNIGCEGTDQG